jgi:hypothetical protein
MEISLVPVGHVSRFLPQLMPHFYLSEKWTRGRAVIDDLLRFILNGQMQLWIGHDEAKVHGHYITEIKTYPQCKMLCVQYCAGNTGIMEQLEHKAFETLEKFAQDADCAGIEFIGRPGWRKAAQVHGFEVQDVMYQKFFGEKP